MAVNSNAPVVFTFAGLPPSYCFSTPEQFALDLTAGLSGYIPGQYTTIIASESEPVAADRGKLWYKLGVGGVPLGVIYRYFGGNWVSQNPEAASGFARRLFEGTPAQIWAYDGGSGDDPAVTAPSSAGGAMWEIDTNWTGRSPMGVGIVPTSNPSKTLSLSEDFGNGARLNLTQEVAPHTHNVWPVDNGDGNADKNWSHFDAGGETCAGGTGFPISPNDACPLQTLLRADNPTYTAAQEPAPIIHPVRGCYIIKRTVRVFYKA